MNLPVSVEDPSLLNHEPLRSYVAVFKCSNGLRSLVKYSVSQFVEQMQRNDQAAAAAKKWAHLVFQGALSDEGSFEVTDGGEQLYRAFFEYQCLLHEAQQEGGDITKVRECENRIYRRGVGAIKAIELEDHNAHSPRSKRGGGREGKSKGKNKQRFSRPSYPKEACLKVEAAICHPDAGDNATSSSLVCGSHSMVGSSAIQRGSAFDPLPASSTQQSIPQEEPRKRPALKREKKRKASSQKPPIITPSDVSEDDKESSKTRAAAAANSIFHQSKRIASNPSRQPDDSFELTDQVDEARRTNTNNKQHRESTISISQPQSPVTSFQFDDSVSHSSIEGGRGATFSLSSCKHNGEGLSNVSTQPIRAGSKSGGLRKIKLIRHPEHRANKRVRRVSMSALDSEPAGGPESTDDLRTKFLLGPTTLGPLGTGPPATRGNIDVESEARRKRTRLEFEAAFVASDEGASTSYHEFLGPDSRLLRPLPQKVRDVRLVPKVRGVPCGAPSLELAYQLVRDAASNALAIQRGGIEPDLADWTQEGDHDEECDDLSGDDDDETNDVHVTTATSSPQKPLVPAPPHIWAESRQEVCESFEYFRCYHGGVYSRDNIVKGYLLGAYAASRDVFHHNGKLIISHGGGKSESILDVRRGPKRYQTDQDQEASDKSVRALLKTWKDRRPLVLLADDKYALFPYDLASANYTYVVLGLYWISHAWAECQSARDGSGRVVRWKFAFQWCEDQGNPWWLPQEVTNIIGEPPSSSQPSNKSGDPGIQCENCQEESPFVYKQGWMCLNPRCNVFWSIDDEDTKQLDYRDEFLSLLPQKFDRLPNIIPTRVVTAPGGVTTTYACSKGWHCSKCGRLSCRYKWECWECSNCNFKHIVNGRLRSPKEFWHQRPPKGFLHSQIGKESGVLACRLEPVNLGVHKGFTNRLTFILPHDRGRIHLILGTPMSNGDANDIFQLYQQQASTGELKLRRYPLRNHRARGRLLTNYFSQNSGEPYQYVGGSGQTVPFCEAPDCVRRALALIKERSRLALRNETSFNEVLSAAYMERQKMSFHSDSEKGLGPIVASLSLGSAALMHFRPHINVENPKAKSTYALSLVLRHASGDVLVMDGDGVQKYYEHTVVPMNFRIAATARCIGST